MSEPDVGQFTSLIAGIRPGTMVANQVEATPAIRAAILEADSAYGMSEDGTRQRLDAWMAGGHGPAASAAGKGKAAW